MSTFMAHYAVPAAIIAVAIVLCLGLLPVERLVLGRATGVGNLAVLLGAATGRDGIGGVSVLASSGFDDSEADAAKPPALRTHFTAAP